MTKILYPTSTPDNTVTKSSEPRLGKEVKPEHTAPYGGGGGLTVSGNPAHGQIQVHDVVRFAFRNNHADVVSCFSPKAST